MFKYKIISFCILLLISIPNIATSQNSYYTDITVDEAYEMANCNKNVIFMDIRDCMEFLKERIKISNVICLPYFLFFDYREHRFQPKNPNCENPNNAAAHIPRSIIRFGKIFNNKDIILYCNIGETSKFMAGQMSVYAVMKENNVHIYNLVGGIKAWEEAGYPVRML